MSDQEIRGDAPSTDASEGAVTVTIDGCRVEVCDSNGEAPFIVRFYEAIDRVTARDRDWRRQFHQSLERLTRNANL